ncbi:hypothetical protein GF312_21670 [Candidatus Poribacteria bacterium]|nr:hypothetical protein [Candidatus Poribacteria bacterium]
MRFFVFLLSLSLLFISIKGYCQDELPPEWLFDEDEDIQMWQGANQLEVPELDDVKDQKGETRSILRLVSTGGDPYIFPDGNWQGFIPDIIPFDGGEYDTIYVGVRTNVSSTWQVYYITEEDGVYAEAQRQNFQVNASDDFQELEFVMERGGWQERTITGFRLDPGNVAGVES